jgi:hypothetical protein
MGGRKKARHTDNRPGDCASQRIRQTPALGKFALLLV